MYILDQKCISAQNTFGGGLFQDTIVAPNGLELTAIEPSYSEVPRGVLRRMGRSNRMATGAGLPLLQNHKVDGMILGTSDGGMGDCHKFLNQMMEYEEGTLTPTNFVQGAPSSIAGSLALMAQNRGYNNTHSDLGLSFETSLRDAMLLFNEGAAENLLVGAVEEISEALLSLEKLLLLQNPALKASIHGEGAAMFVLGRSQENALALIRDLRTICFPTKNDVVEIAQELISKNGVGEVDLLITGRQGADRPDEFYDLVQHDLFGASGVVRYKDLFGECASSTAFAIWVGTQLLKGERAPEMVVEREKKGKIQNILIYNHFRGMQHSFILLQAAG